MTNMMAKTVRIAGVTHIGGILPEIGRALTGCATMVPADMVTATAVHRWQSGGPRPDLAPDGDGCPECIR